MPRHWAGWCAGLLAWALAGCSVPRIPLPSLGSGREGIVHLAVIDAGGDPQILVARICRPAEDGRATVAIINHGAGATGDERPDMTPLACDAEPVQWFTSRGYMVISPLRRGYGASGGEWAENAGACASPDYIHAGDEAARDLDAVVRFVAKLPFAKPTGMVMIGEDAGGWATLAYDSYPHDPVAAFVNIAGGRGARSGTDSRHVCRPDLLADAAAHFGATAKTKMLWLYAAEDHVFSPEIVADLHAGFERNGGKVEFVLVDPAGMEGHDMFTAPGGSEVWGPFVSRYLTDQAGSSG